MCYICRPQPNTQTKESAIPASVHITKEQAEFIHTLEEDVVICELPGQHDGTIDVWVADDYHSTKDSHRSIIVEPDGNVLGDGVVPD